MVKTSDIITDANIRWLLEGEAPVRFLTKKNLLKKPLASAEMKKEKQALLAEQKIADLLTELKTYPGKKDSPCPYATLLMLRLISAFPVHHSHKAAKTGFETLETLWQKRKETKPYLFAMGTDFKKLKLPLIWYDILHVLEVTTRFPQHKKYNFVNELKDLLSQKADENGRFTAESVYRAYKHWDFGQKRQASRWISCFAYQILQR